MAVLVVAVLIISLFMGTVVFAGDNFKNLRAWFGDISIYRNDSQVHLVGEDKPFIIDGRTYVPLRAMAELFNKEVGWDGEKFRIDLDDKPEDSFVYILQQLVDEQAKVRELEAKVEELETGKKGDIRELESYLNRQHDTYKKVRFDIDLYKTKDDIDVDIYVDLDYDYREWDGLTTSNIKTYLQDVVNDILYDYKNADIKGSIMDSSTSRKSTLISFYTKSNGTVVIDKDYRDSSRYDDLDDLENYLNKNHDRYYGNHEREYAYFDIELYGDEDDIEVYVTGYYGDDLDHLREYEIKDYLEELYEEIRWEFSYAEVYGYIEDDYSRCYFDFDSRGNVYLDWY